MESHRYHQSAELLNRAAQVLAGGVSSEFRKYNHPHALFYTHGNGCYIYDADGNEYLDFTLSQGPLLLGHSHPAVLSAVEAYAKKGQLFAGQHIQEIELAEKISQLIPSAELMRFCLDGSEAVQTAFRVARAKTGKSKFLRFEGHYHGWLDNVCWGISAATEAEMGSREHPNVSPWTQGLPPQSREEAIVIPWNDLDLLENILKEQHSDIAAIITEPVMCNSGCILPKKGFLEGIRRLCTEYGIALIFDEVITGFRLSLGGAQQYFDIEPDISIFAKAIASGYPLSVVAGKKEWMNLIAESKVIHAGTMNTGCTSVAASLATITVLEKTQPYDKMFQLGQQLMEGLRAAAKETGHDMLVQGPGPMFNISFTTLHEVKDFRDTFQTDKVKLKQFIAGMHDRGIRVIGRGLWYIGIQHTEEHVLEAIEVAKNVLKTL